MTTPAIETIQLTKTFAPERRGEAAVTPLDHCDLMVPRGAFYGLLGRNGEGKSTLMRCLLGLLHPSSGKAQLLGMEFAKAKPVARARVAYVPQRHQLAGSMTLRQYCTFYSFMYPKWQPDYAAALTERMGLAPDKSIRALSGGVQRKVAILLALASGAEVLLLDEPAAGLDPVARSEFIDELIDVMATAEGVTVLFSTHILSDLEHLADYIGILDKGRMALSAEVETLKQQIRRVQVIFPTEEAARHAQIPEALRLERSGRVLNAIVRDPEATTDALRRTYPQVDVTTFSLNLDELFIELVQSDMTQVDVREVA